MISDQTIKNCFKHAAKQSRTDVMRFFCTINHSDQQFFVFVNRLFFLEVFKWAAANDNVPVLQYIWDSFKYAGRRYNLIFSDAMQWHCLERHLC